MEKQNVGECHRSYGAALLHEKCERISRRTAVIAAILAFIGSYIFGISQFGIIPAIAFGWLPCSVAAWLTAIAIASIGRQVIRHGIAA